jgi:hypothetical protein
LPAGRLTADDVEGLVPVLINVVPIVNIFQTLGMSPDEEREIRQAMELDPAEKPKEMAYSS